MLASISMTSSSSTGGLGQCSRSSSPSSPTWDLSPSCSGSTEVLTAGQAVTSSSLHLPPFPAMGVFSRSAARPQGGDAVQHGVAHGDAVWLPPVCSSCCRLLRNWFLCSSLFFDLVNVQYSAPSYFECTLVCVKIGIPVWCSSYMRVVRLGVL